MALMDEPAGRIHSPLAAGVGFHPVVDIQDLSIRRGGREVLSGVNLAVEEGDFLTVAGPNGGGKTTLLQALLGEIKPSRGRIAVFGRKPRRWRRGRSGVGYAPQRPAFSLAFPASVYDAVLMGAIGVSGKFLPIQREYKQRARFLLERLRIDHLRDNLIGEISCGMLQRILIARALVSYPRLLLLDEPLKGLDSDGQTQFFECLEEIKREMNLTIILVTQELRHLAQCSERIACLNGTLHWHERAELFKRKPFSGDYPCELDAALEADKEWRGKKFQPQGRW
ncbi:MAG: metal ABC transporter ATP-binding protein [Candidatus Omnitrophota bacterium]